LLSLDYLGIPQKDLVRILNYSRKKNISFFEACEEVDKIFVKDETKAKIKQVTDIVNGHISILNSKTAGFLLYDFLEKSGILQKLINPDTPFAERKVQNISKFFDRLKSYETKHEDSSVFAVVDWLDLASELGESPLAEEFDWTTVDAVNILTIHSSKGLEFPVVFLVNLVSQRFPTVERREQIPIPEELIKEVLPQGDYHLQEERRLFYVGMTRAMDTLYFTAASYYGDGRREKKISPFVFEALGDDVSGAEFATKEAEQLSFIDYKSGEDTEITSDVDSEMRPNIDSLSYSQIETFRTCPLHFKLKYIYNLPHAPSASQSFGSSIHQSLRVFYERIREGAKPSERMIFKIFENNWIGEGFVSKSHEEKFFQKGKLYLSGFLKYGFNAKTVPAALEQKFVIFLPPKDGERPLRIKGVIDRIDVFEDGSIEIIDYKTGATIPSQKEVDGNLQLTFYALAATYIKEPPFGMDVDRIKLSLYFLDSQEKITTTRDAKSLERAVDEIYEIRKEIESSDFRCSGSMLCEACEYKLLCNSDTW
jgi:DNA helicase-2/ATP-dependent DNA helicase PcrA